MRSQSASSAANLTDLPPYETLLRGLGRRIRRRRERAGISRADLATLCRSNESTVGRWERGEVPPRIHQLLRLSEYFRTPLEDLLLGRSGGIRCRQIAGAP